MKFSLLFLFFSSYCYATESRVVNGKIQFPAYKVNGVYCWNEIDKNEAVSALNESQATISSQTIIITVVPVIPAQFELNLSTICPKIESNSDFKKLQTRAGLFEYILKIKQEFDLAIILNDSQKIFELTQKFNWLKSYYNTLP